jgi:hypothetical protein
MAGRTGYADPLSVSVAHGCATMIGSCKHLILKGIDNHIFVVHAVAHAWTALFSASIVGLSGLDVKSGRE